MLGNRLIQQQSLRANHFQVKSGESMELLTIYRYIYLLDDHLKHRLQNYAHGLICCYF